MRALGFWVPLAVLGLAAMPAAADPFLFSTGGPDGRIGAASRPGGITTSAIETADDFILNRATNLTSASFVGLIPTGASVDRVTVEIYRVFPTDSETGRTSGSPGFSTANVPTRVNSPADVALLSRDSTGGTLSFSVTDFGGFSVNNSVLPGGIHALPNQTTGGDGPVTGDEVEFDVNFLTALMLNPDHYFFVPQVTLSNGDFLWLSALRPITGGSGPFTPDLQGWTRDDGIDPDWLRVGTDIVGGTPAPSVNFTFALAGETVAVPEPSGFLLIGLPLAALGWLRRMRASGCERQA
jgi:hypothetical protein